MRVCAIDGCPKPHRARGYCSTHYNRRHQPNWHAPVTVACVECGTLVERGSKSDRRHVCSRTCWRTLVGATSGYDADCAAADRARKLGATVIEKVSLLDVFERDGWRCQMCGIALTRDTEDYAPSMATVDHVVPLRRGGSHSMSNVQAACLRCNSAKQDRLDLAAA